MEKKAILLILLIVLLFVMFAGADDIHSAVQQGDLLKTQNLIAKDPSVLDSKTEDGRTPLHVAVMGGDEYFYRGFAEEAADQKFKSKFVCAENKGDSFILHK